MSPPAKVLADADVRLIVPVPVTVRLVDVLVFHPIEPVAEPAIDQVPEPTAIVLTADVVLTKDEPLPLKVRLYPFASTVPELSVTAPPLLLFVLKASCNVTEPLGVSIANACVNVLPALVIV